MASSIRWLPSTTIVASLSAITAPFQRRKRGVEVRLVIGEQAPTSHDAVLIRSIAKAHRYYEAITRGSTFEEIAEAENLTVRRVLQVIELAFIAPDIVKAIVRGEQPVELTARWLGQNPLPSDWQTQRQVVASR